jgi:hypothetical protein
MKGKAVGDYIYFTSGSVQRFKENASAWLYFKKITGYSHKCRYSDIYFLALKTSVSG